MKKGTIKEAENLLNFRYSRKTIRRWAQTGKYGVVGGKQGDRWVVDLDTLPPIKWLERKSA